MTTSSFLTVSDVESRTASTNAAQDTDRESDAENMYSAQRRSAERVATSFAVHLYGQDAYGWEFNIQQSASNFWLLLTPQLMLILNVRFLADE